MCPQSHCASPLVCAGILVAILYGCGCLGDGKSQGTRGAPGSGSRGYVRNPEVSAPLICAHTSHSPRQSAPAFPSSSLIDSPSLPPYPSLSLPIPPPPSLPPLPLLPSRCLQDFEDEDDDEDDKVVIILSAIELVCDEIYWLTIDATSTQDK
jgi:hypothetical protein